MLGLSRFSKAELSEIFKIWIGFAPLSDYEVRDIEFKPVVEVEFTVDLPELKRQYGLFCRNYYDVLEERGSNHYDFLKGVSLRKEGMLKVLVEVQRGGNWGYKTKDKRIYNFVHIMEQPLGNLPLYINSPDKIIADIASKRLEYGK